MRRGCHPCGDRICAHAPLLIGYSIPERERMRLLLTCLLGRNRRTVARTDGRRVKAPFFESIWGRKSGTYGDTIDELARP